MNTVRVLLIDVADTSQLLPTSDATRGEQFRIIRNATLLQGLDTLRDSTFDVVLLSLSLPDSSVSDSISRILQVARDLPVIALASEGETTKITEALSLGAYGYFLKGCQCGSLSQTIRHAMAPTRLIREREHTLQRPPDKEERVAALLASNSHRLRNALACIRQFGKILVDGLAGRLSDEQSEYVGIMLENVSTIRSVLDNTLGDTSGSVEEPRDTMGALSKAEK